MKTKLSLLATCLLFSSCNMGVDVKSIEKKAALINKYEMVALQLAKENRELHAEVKRLEFQIQKLKQDKAFIDSKAALAAHPNSAHESAHGTAHGPSRGIASVPVVDVTKDLVEFKTYKWSAEDMLKIADKEFKSKNFEKAAQFYTSLATYYPSHKKIDDEFLFKAGISSYESGSHHDWTLKHFEALMHAYPTSSYYRSAKLWVALTHMKLGQKEKFFATVEEFRKKYRNTNEWKILSSYYEKIEEKTHE